LIKTTHPRWEALKAAVVAQHPYDCPELIAFETVGGLPAYLNWVAAETAVADSAAEAPPS
jgi:periplasmic divalent cation tolerance protein